MSRLSADIDLDRRGQGDRLRARAALGASLGLWLDPDPDRAHQERRRAERADAGRQPRRRMGGPDRARQPDPQRSSPKDIKGRLVILPSANFPAAMAGQRTSPIDDGNLNRSFPGNPEGTITEQIAHFIEHVLLPTFDYSFDFHSGGSSLAYIPSALAPRHGDEARMTEGARHAEGVRRAGELPLGRAAGRRPHLHLGLVPPGRGVDGHRAGRRRAGDAVTRSRSRRTACAACWRISACCRAPSLRRRRPG